MEIIGHEEYEIFEDGSVYSHKTNQFLKPIINKRTGYSQVVIWGREKSKAFQIHRLVGEYFLENPHNKPQINHKNGIKTDNRVENLEWVTDSENKLHCYETGLKDKNIISKPVAQIDVNTNEIIATFSSMNEAGRELGINMGSISNCCNGKSKTYKGYKWRLIVDKTE